MDIRAIRISDYTYQLPEDRIAKYPLTIRDSSKLLLYRNGETTEDVYRNISNHLPESSLIIFNDTRVIEARLLFQKPSGGTIEIFCLEPSDQYPTISEAMGKKGRVLWKCLIGGASKWKHGTELSKKITMDSNEVVLMARMKERLADSFIIELSWTPQDYSFTEILKLAGAIPLPPYLKRAAEIEDTERYQTTYAKSEGSVAAPTAGLHFTQAVMESLVDKNIKLAFTTLHVGAATFKPVKTPTIGEHEMHREFIEVDILFIQTLMEYSTIVAVGTTSLRTIETLYWLAVKLMTNHETSEELCLYQWEAYELKQDIPVNEALHFMLDWMKKNDLEKILAKTHLLIIPGYRLRIADILVTNFHQPQSTLLLLVAAIAGEKWKEIYEYALANNFRFLSYGDGCLIYA